MSGALVLVSILWKAVATAGVIVTAGRLAQRAGPVLTSVLITLPVNAGPGFFFIALEQEAEFVRAGALTAFSVTGAVLLFCTAWVHAARRGGFLPPVRLPRRMWAASDVTFHNDLCVGDTVTRRAEVEAIEEKSGRSGALTFVTVRHDYEGPSGPALTDRQTIVYREAPADSERGKAPETKPAPSDGTFARRLTPDINMLFRYSALIFNAHRIHFDQPFVTGTEGYPDLVVHGPLIATLLADLVRRERPRARIARLGFRAAAPLFAGRAMTVAGKDVPDGLALWAADDRGGLCARADVILKG